jgi:hypothetical protein
MKKEKREQSIELRKSGASIKDIAKELKVSSSSVSLWVRDLEYPKDVVRERLRVKNSIRATKHAETIRSLFRIRRSSYQEIGRKLAKKNESLFISGCSLYWAEGAKCTRNTFAFCNTDSDMIKVIMSFVKQYFPNHVNKCKLYIDCYLDKGLSKDEILNYWLDITGLPRFTLGKKHSFKEGKTSKTHKKLKYGTCRITICSSEVAQTVFGGIQEMFSINRPEWLDMIYD